MKKGFTLVELLAVIVILAVLALIATPLRARIPIYASDTAITEVTSKTNASYLYDNIDPNGMTAPYGYLTLSSGTGSSIRTWVVDYSGSVSEFNEAYRDTRVGVRPVINLKL